MKRGFCEILLKLILPLFLYHNLFSQINPKYNPFQNDSNSSHIRYSYGEQYGTGYNCAESGNGLYSSVAWSLSAQRISFFGNANNYSLWEFPLLGTIYNYTSVSQNGNYVGVGSGSHFYILNGINGSLLLAYNITSPDSGVSGPVAITSSGNFLVGTAVRNDSSIIFGFTGNSNIPVWRFKIPDALVALKISGNDSLIIINSYSKFWVLRSYTGISLYQGLINPNSNNGSQSTQGISGNGNIIAIINYEGYLRVFQWNGAVYNFLWQHQEPPGAYYNWMSSVDVSYDGTMVACGTLDNISDSLHDGKIKLFNVSAGSTPLWTYSGCGDEVSSVSFSKNGKILAAATWGNLYNPYTNNLLVFKTSYPSNIPLYAISGAGSFFWCSVSDDGQTVIGCGKAVHVRLQGGGGTFYNLFIDTSAIPIGIKNISNNLPAQFKLYQNYPNPFNPTTIIKFDIPYINSPLLERGVGLPAEASAQAGGLVILKIYNILGQVVATLVNKKLDSGTYSVYWDATNYPSGIYFYKIEFIDTETGRLYFTETKRMIFLK